MAVLSRILTRMRGIAVEGRISRRGAVAMPDALGALAATGTDVDCLQSLIVARLPRVAVVADAIDVEAKLSNKPINPTHFAASRRLLSQAARRGSCAGYRQR